MRKLKLWHLLPALSLSILFINTAVVYGDEGGQEPIITLQDMPADQLAEMKALMSRKGKVNSLQRANPLEGRPRPSQTIHRGRRIFQLDRNLLALPEVEDGRFDRHSLSKALVTNPITVTVNGATSATLTGDDSLEIVITFSDSLKFAEATFWVDMDADGLLDDTIDFDLDEGGLAIDNDEEDLDPRDSVFKIILYPGEEEGILSVTNLKLLLMVQDDLASDTVTINIGETVTTDYASGTVTPNVANVIIVAFPHSDFDSTSTGGDDELFPFLTVTDAAGLYNIYLDAPDSLNIFTVDFLGVQAGLVPDTSYHNEGIAGAVTGLDFNYVTPTSFIAGFVKDPDGFFIPGVTLFAFSGDDGPGFEFEATTDAGGAYTIGVLPGHYYVEVSDDVIPDYMVSESQRVDVMDGETATANFTLYAATSTITGMVTLDGMPLGGLEIQAWGRPQGAVDADPNGGFFTFAESDPLTGDYELHVSPLVNSEGYFIWPRDWPDGTYMNNKLDHIPAGASMVNLEFKTANGGLTGVVTILGSMPLDTLYDVGIFIYDTTTGIEAWTGPDMETGVYTAPLPAGNYFVEVYTQRFKPYKAGPIPVGEVFVTHDISLEEFDFNSSIFGQVTDAVGGFGLGGANVWIWNQALQYGDHTFTDSAGFFNFGVPAGDYDVGTEAPGYFGDYRMVNAPVDGSVEVNFALEVFSFQAPVIHTIKDKPDDQGGWALIHFSGGSSDRGPFFGWSIWSVPGPEYLPEQMINVGFFLGIGEQNYTVLVPTFVDSNAANSGSPELYQSWYVISGFGDGDNDGGLFFANSPPASGWSVDNIAPGVPAGLALSVTAGGFNLAWEASLDADYQYNVVNVVYTSGGDVTLAVSGNSIELTTANISLDGDFDVSVAAVDANGNYSDFSNALNSVTLDLEDGLNLPGKYALLANYPNPFNPSTTLQFALPQNDRVSLIIYDLMGREIRALVSGDLPAGHHQVVWNGRNGNGHSVATGVYFYRIVTGDGFTATRKMVFMK